MQTISSEHKIGEIVSLNYQAAGVFSKYNIDFCCGGGISVAEACKRKNLPAEVLLKELNLAVRQNSAETLDYASWSVSLLISWITEKHHRYVRGATDVILAWSAKVADRHGQTLPENIRIHELFKGLVPELLAHLASEEDRVFPLLLELEARQKAGTPIADELRNALKAELTQTENEHDHAGAVMKEINALTLGYNPPEMACTTWRVLWHKLSEFEQDLHKHVHLENNILFRKAGPLLV